MPPSGRVVGSSANAQAASIATQNISVTHSMLANFMVVIGEQNGPTSGG
jgi:hypothetical protein